MTDYATLLQKNGLKATFQRINILASIEKNGHMNIDDIYAKVIKMHASLSLATIYKNITLMVKNTVLVEVPIDGKKSKYELAKNDHIHLICTKCGSVEDREHPKHMLSTFTYMTKEEKFKLVKQQINLYGVCQECI